MKRAHGFPMSARGVATLVILSLMTAALPAWAPPAAAATVKGVDFPDTVIIDGRDCALNGVGVRKKFFVNVYLGGLYVTRPSADPAEVIGSPEPKRVVLHFLHSKVKSSQLKEAWQEGFDANLSQVDESLRERLARFVALFEEDLLKGETIVATYLPGTGTEVSIKGVVRDTIPGEDFMKALFSIWFGEVPADKGLKEGMLGG